jgi:ectoine hydroxylase-related dioxygenase (phytanoyl-CoA dioxygenase family)
VFDPDFANDVIIKWEGVSDVVHGVEPLAHLSPALRDWALDARFVEPMVDFVGDEQPVLFTEKLNLKRPQHGGPNPPHQDYPYWADTGGAEDIATAMLFLDDATVENGCLRVAPGSHKSGKWTTRTDGDEFLANEIDMTQYDDVDLVPLELEAGSVVMFGSFLVHQSLPNHSDRERRSLLYSYQPAGREHSLEALRRMLRGRS